MNKALAEFIGTFALVFFGVGTAVIAGMGSGATSVDILGIATAFGLARRSRRPRRERCCWPRFPATAWWRSTPVPGRNAGGRRTSAPW
jgi:hypothetical protein